MCSVQYLWSITFSSLPGRKGWVSGKVLADKMEAEVVEWDICETPQKGKQLTWKAPSYFPLPFSCLRMFSEITQQHYLYYKGVSIQEHVSTTSEWDACTGQAMGMGG